MEEQTLELETSNIEEENKEQTEQENKQNVAKSAIYNRFERDVKGFSNGICKKLTV